jgi:hypothetical protein
MMMRRDGKFELAILPKLRTMPPLVTEMMSPGWQNKEQLLSPI